MPEEASPWKILGNVRGPRGGGGGDVQNHGCDMDDFQTL